jgi:hypothetical protein
MMNNAQAALLAAVLSMAGKPWSAKQINAEAEYFKKWLDEQEDSNG